MSPLLWSIRWRASLVTGAARRALVADATDPGWRWQMSDEQTGLDDEPPRSILKKCATCGRTFAPRKDGAVRKHDCQPLPNQRTGCNIGGRVTACYGDMEAAWIAQSLAGEHDKGERERLVRGLLRFRRRERADS